MSPNAVQLKGRRKAAAPRLWVRGPISNPRSRRRILPRANGFLPRMPGLFDLRRRHKSKEPAAKTVGATNQEASSTRETPEGGYAGFRHSAISFSSMAPVLMRRQKGSVISTVVEPGPLQK